VNLQPSLEQDIGQTGSILAGHSQDECGIRTSLRDASLQRVITPQLRRLQVRVSRYFAIAAARK
jgi:hypothetical protein